MLPPLTDPSYSESANIEIKNNTILSNGWGVYLASRVRIWSGKGGLECRGRNLKVIANTVRNNNNTLEFDELPCPWSPFLYDPCVGVEVGGSGLIISDNIIQNSSFGLRITYYDICPWTVGSTDIVVENNKIECNKVGLSIDFCNNIIIRNNTMLKNQWSFGLHIEEIEDASTIQLEPSNFVDGGRTYYFVNQSNLSINTQTLPNVGYLAVANSENLTVCNLNFSKNIQGLYLFNVKKFDVHNVTVKNCYLGIQEELSSNGTIKNCTFLWNDSEDLLIWNSTMNLIT